MQLTVDEIFDLLQQENHFFSVTFERRTNGVHQVAGDLRTMLCRTGMSRYKLGLIPDAVRAEEDFRHGILTVWSLNDYNRNRRQGMSDFNAGYNAWRRIDLLKIKALSVVGPELLPPTIRNELHELTNVFRLANMPESAI